jgi:hypothetical protein
VNDLGRFWELIWKGPVITVLTASCRRPLLAPTLAPSRPLLAGWLGWLGWSERSPLYLHQLLRHLARQVKAPSLLRAAANWLLPLSQHLSSAPL